MSLQHFLTGVLLLTILMLVSGTTGDPDLWGHVRFGQDMLAQGAIRIPDDYSFTSDRPWLNHEWLSEIVMAAAFEQLGPVGLNLLRIAVIAGVLGLAWYALRGVDRRYTIPVLSAGALGIFLRAHPIRPQLFSLLLFAVLLTVVTRCDRHKSLRPLLAVPALMAVWANCHGGWIVGLGIFGTWCLMTALTLSWRDRAGLTGISVLSLAATLLNPYGLGMWQFLATTVRIDRPMIADWQPLYALPPGLWISWIAAFGIVTLAVMKCGYKGNEKPLAIAGLLGLMAVRVSRLEAFFAIAAMFFAAHALRQVQTVRSSEHSSGQTSFALAAAFAVYVIVAGVVVIPRVLSVPAAPGSIPDGTVTRYVRSQGLTGNVLTWFDWGQHAIWHFGPALKVSMDGRRETVYTAEVVAEHMRFYFAEPGAWRYADRLQPDYVWIPKRLPVVQELRSNGWNLLCEGSSSILLTRRHVAAPCDASSPRESIAFPDAPLVSANE